MSRRQLLGRGVCLSLLPLINGCSPSTIACADPELLSTSEAHLRNTLEYTELTGDASQACRGCEFFSATSGTDCGHCDILDGSVNASGYCTSWATKA